jgi:adenylate cyclase
VVDACSTELAFQPIGDVILKGKRQSTTLYNPIPEGRRSESFIRDYRNAYQRFAMNDAADIREAFFNLIQRYPNEPLAQFHAQRVRDGMLTALIVMEDK